LASCALRFAQSSAMASIDYVPVVLSSRGQRALLAGAEIEKMAPILGNQYSLQNPNGLVNCGIAENTLIQDDFVEYLNANLRLDPIDLTYGDNVGGSTRLFSAITRLLGRYFNPAVPVAENHIITGGGLSALTDQLTELLCEPGDAVLIARPYYTGFDIDVSARSQAVMYGVDIGDADPAGPGSLAAFEEALTTLKAADRTARAVIICNPNNPLGFNYPRETLIEYCKFCEKHGLHLISDEIYALSQYGSESATPFTSILAIDVAKEGGCNPARVHFTYGMSKDFGANGLRIGVVVSQHNADLRRAFFGLWPFVKPSSASDALWSRLLLDDAKLDEFVRTNRQHLGDTCNYCCSWFDQQGIPYVRPNAAQFIFINLGAFLREKDDQGKAISTPDEKDKDLWMALLNGGVLTGLGVAFHHTEFGWFRFTFSVKRESLDVAFARMEKILAARRA